MSEQTRPKPTRMTVCDLCNAEIDETQPDERGSLTWGWVAYPVEMGERPTGWRQTTHAWLQWPPGSRTRTAYDRRRSDPEQFRQRRYDFHAECILRLVEDGVAARTTPAPRDAHEPAAGSAAGSDAGSAAGGEA